MDEKSTDILSLRVTQEQRELIYAMWAHYDWDVEIAPNLCSGCQGDKPPIVTVCCANDDDIGPQDPRIPPIEGEQECPFCLCRPCVTNEQYRQAWWETDNFEPNDKNSSYRKEHYRRFWVMLLIRGVWHDPVI